MVAHSQLLSSQHGGAHFVLKFSLRNSTKIRSHGIVSTPPIRVISKPCQKGKTNDLKRSTSTQKIINYMAPRFDLIETQFRLLAQQFQRSDCLNTTFDNNPSPYKRPRMMKDPVSCRLDCFSSSEKSCDGCTDASSLVSALDGLGSSDVERATSLSQLNDSELLRLRSVIDMAIEMSVTRSTSSSSAIPVASTQSLKSDVKVDPLFSKLCFPKNEPLSPMFPFSEHENLG